jgi:hypothetical protein
MSLLDDASLIVTPNAEKAGKLYSIIPTNGNGDFTVTRATTATRTNSSGLIESTPINEPRLDYSLGSCPNILLEPQRTNLALRSEEFDNAISWIKLNGSTITTNTTTAPNGTLTADTYQASNLAFGGILRQTPTILSATSYTFSFHVKKNNYRYVGIRFNTSANGQRFPNYDFDTDTLNKQGVTCDLSRVLLPNGWVRLILTFTSTTTIGSCDIAITTANGDTSTALSGTEKIEVWGAQLEAGAYATSYIPTTSASVTRNADVISRGNIFTNGLITASGGTWFVDFRNNRSLVRDASTNGLFLSDATFLSFGLRIKTYAPNNRLAISKVVAGTETPIYTTTTDAVKLAIKWNATTADLFVNGVKVVAATAFTPTAMESLSNNLSVPLNINSMALFPTPLTDTQCIALTT